MPNSVITPSLASGELSPSMYGRVDLAKYHAGVALMRNFFVDYRGGAASRFGTMFVGVVKDSTTANRLIPFTFSTIQTYALVFGNFTMRVVKDGAYVTEPPQSVASVTIASPTVIGVPSHGFATGDLVFFEDLAGPVELDNRFFTAQVTDANHFTLLDMFGNPVGNAFTYVGIGTVARVFTLATPYAAADLELLKYSQSADTMTLTHAAYPEQQLTRTQHWVWTIVPTQFIPTVAIPTNLAAVASSPSSTVYNYVVTAVSANGISESLPSNVATCSNETLSGELGLHNTLTWDGNPGDSLYNIYRTAENPTTAPAAGALFGYIGSTTPAAINSFVDSNIQPDFTQTPPIANDPFAIGQINSVPVTAGGSGYTTTALTVTDATGSGAQLLAVLVGGVITGVIVLVAGANYTNPTISASVGTGATFGPAVLSPANYPACSTYYQQRQVRGGMANQPDGLVFSKTGDFANMSFSTPGRANDEVQVSLASQTVNPIKHMVPLTSLVVLTGAGAWRVDGGSQSDSVTPDHINAVPQAYNGCSDVPPIVVNYDILYVQAKGSIVRDLSYNFYVNVYTGEDISMLSNHLFFGHQITEWCWAEEPFKVVWAVREDGILLSLTFLKEQQIYGWARHDTQGLYKSICAISEGQENAVYVIVQRLVNGQYLQYIERFASRDMGGDTAIGIPADITKAWCVDAGLQYPLTYPAATLTPVALTSPPIISSASLIAGGSGYTAPVVSVSDPTGSGATFSVTVAGGVVTAVSVVDPGINYTNPQLSFIDSTGSGATAHAIVTSPVAMVASSNVFTQFNVGQVVRVNGGVGVVASVPIDNEIIVNLSQPLNSLWPAPQGTWSLTAPVTVVSGLDHLDGQTVTGLADGNVIAPVVVSGGSVTLQNPATAITIGLPYVCQLQSLNLDIQGEATIQGKRKKINAVTVRVQDTRGLKAGPDFQTLSEIKERNFEPMGQAVALRTLDERVNIQGTYTVEGRVCIQQDQPLPATILALVPEVTIGDQ